MKRNLLIAAAMFMAVCVNAQGTWFTVQEGYTKGDSEATPAVPATVVCEGQEGLNGFEIVNAIPNATVKLGGATAWESKSNYDADKTFVAKTNGKTYPIAYIQGGTNGVAGGSLDKDGACASHVQFTPAINGKVWVIAKYGKNKPIWFAKVKAADVEDLTVGSMEEYKTDIWGQYPADDEKGLSDAEAAADVYNALPLEVEAGNTYFFFVSGSKIMLIGLDFEAADPAGISAVATAKAENARMYNLAGQEVGKNFKGIVVVNGKKFMNK